MRDKTLNQGCFFYRYHVYSMNPTNVTDLNPKEYYYIRDRYCNERRFIGQFVKVEHIRNDMYVAEFNHIRNTIDTPDINLGYGYRHNYWFVFYPMLLTKYKRKIKELYETAIQLKLQEITGDEHFIW